MHINKRGSVLNLECSPIIDSMDSNQIIAELDGEIARLQQARSLLSDRGGWSSSGKAAKKTVKKRTLSPEARARIAAAQKKK